MHVKAEGLIESLSGQSINDLSWMRHSGLEVGGWVAAGVTYSSHNPDNHNNFPITFNDRSSEVMMNQLYLYVERQVNLEADHWNIGGRFDFMFGTDARFAQASGLDDKIVTNEGTSLYDIAFPQAYLEVFAPVGNGLTAKLGHFYTIIGYEVVTAPDNFFYSHAYTMQYAEPFTHTGVLFGYTINDNISINAGAVLGWDNFDQDPDNWNFLGSLTWTDDSSATTVTGALISGDTDSSSGNNRTMYSLVLSHSFTDWIHYVFQHDFGYEENATVQGEDAFWYGINQYLYFDLTDELSAGIRGEWFRDNNGTRIIPGQPGNYFAVTAGVNWSPMTWMKLRPEIRYDWSDSGAGVYSNLTKDEQFSLALDVIVIF